MGTSIEMSVVTCYLQCSINTLNSRTYFILSPESTFDLMVDSLLDTNPSHFMEVLFKSLAYFYKHVSSTSTTKCDAVYMSVHINGTCNVAVGDAW
jgi:hypothetical protein